MGDGAVRAISPGVVSRIGQSAITITLYYYIVSLGVPIYSASIATGLYAFSAAAVSPYICATIDRRGATPVIFGLIIGYVIVAALIWNSDGGPILIVLCCCLGSLQTPITVLSRSIWPQLTGDRGRLGPAQSLETIITEICWVVGPPLFAFSVTVHGAKTALIIAWIMIAVGTIGFAISPAVRRWKRIDTKTRNQRIFSKRFVILLTMVAASASSQGALQIVILNFALSHATVSTGGVLVAVWALGSTLGGIVYGGRSWSLEPVCRYALMILLATFPVSCMSISLSPIMFGSLLFVSGLFLAPIHTEHFNFAMGVQTDSPTAQAFAWVTTTFQLFFGIGMSLSGLIFSVSGHFASVMFCASVSLCGMMIALSSSSRLRA